MVTRQNRERQNSDSQKSDSKRATPITATGTKQQLRKTAKAKTATAKTATGTKQQLRKTATATKKRLQNKQFLKSNVGWLRLNKIKAQCWRQNKLL